MSISQGIRQITPKGVPDTQRPAIAGQQARRGLASRLEIVFNAHLLCVGPSIPILLLEGSQRQIA